VQLLGYKAQILKRWIDNTDDARPPGCGPLPLPAVISLVVYHGADRWAVPQTLAEAVDADADLRPYLVTSATLWPILGGSRTPSCRPTGRCGSACWC
jgi:hypothetical protein